MKTVRSKVRIANPTSRRAAKRRRTNPGPSAAAAPVQPRRRRRKRPTTTGATTMAKRRRKAAAGKATRTTNPTRKAASKRRKRNPFSFVTKKRAARRRNPHRPLSSPADWVKLSAYALAAMVATRQLPQLVLKTGNSGMKGYAANLAVAVIGAMVAGRYLGSEAAFATALGGGMTVLHRGLTEYMSPVGRYLALSGLGDATAAGTMRGIEDAYFPTPITRNDDGTPYVHPSFVRSIQAQLPPPAALPAAAGVSGVGPFRSTFN